MNNITTSSKTFAHYCRLAILITTCSCYVGVLVASSITLITHLRQREQYLILEKISMLWQTC